MEQLGASVLKLEAVVLMEYSWPFRSSHLSGRSSSPGLLQLKGLDFDHSFKSPGLSGLGAAQDHQPDVPSSPAWAPEVALKLVQMGLLIAALGSNQLAGVRSVPRAVNFRPLYVCSLPGIQMPHSGRCQSMLQAILAIHRPAACTGVHACDALHLPST